MLAQRPWSTLFPYTTLFRSVPAGRLEAEVVVAGEVTPQHPNQHHCQDGGADDHVGAVEAGKQEAGGAVDPRLQGDAVDRKSTRLNSSHVRISYVVFCLKTRI